MFALKSKPAMAFVVLTLTSTIACMKNDIPTSSSAPLSEGDHTTLPFQQWFEAFSTCHLMLVSGTTKPFDTIQRYFPISDSTNSLPVTLFRTGYFARGNEIPIWNLTFTGYCHATLILELNSTDCDTNQGIAQLRTSRQLFIGDKYYQHLVTVTGQFPRAISTKKCRVKPNRAFTNLPLDLTRRGALRLSPHGSDPGLIEIRSLEIPCSNCIDSPRFNSLFKAGDYTSFAKLIEAAETRRQWLLPLIPTIADRQFDGPRYLAKGTNRWALTDSGCWKWHSCNHTFIPPPEDDPSFYYEHRVSMTGAALTDVNPKSTFMLFGDQYYNFITCHHNVPSTNFLHLVEPFETLVWVAFILTTGIFLLVFVKLAAAVQSKWFHALMIIYSQSLGSSVTLPSQFSRGIIKVFLSLFLLLSMIFNNVYRGCITSDVTAPASGDRVEVLADLKNFTLMSQLMPTNEYMDAITQILSYKNATERKVGVAAAIKLIDRQFPYLRQSDTETKLSLLTAMGKEIQAEERNIESLKSTSSGDRLTFLEEQQRRLLSIMSKIAIFETTIGQSNSLFRCNNTALFLLSNTLFAVNFVKDAKVPKPIYVGRERFLRKPYGMTWHNDRVNGRATSTQYTRRSTENGLGAWWSKMAFTFLSKYASVGSDYDGWSKMKTIKKQDVPISMQSNLIASTFIIFGILITLSVVVFVTETLGLFFVTMVTKRVDSKTPVEVIQVQSSAPQSASGEPSSSFAVAIATIALNSVGPDLTQGMAPVEETSHPYRTLHVV